LKSHPRFSVLIPSYNNGGTLGRAIDSVLQQSWPAHEIIVVDDGSTDNTREVVAGYAGRVIYRYQQNAGVSTARNLAASLATGDWLAFLDADDTFAPDRIKVHAEWIADEPDLDFLLGDQELRTPEGKLIQHTLESSEAGRGLLKQFPDQTRIPLHEKDFELLIEDGFGEIRTLSIPRSTFERLGGFADTIRIGEDLHLLIRLCARSRKAGVTPQTLATYYIYPSSALRKDVLKSNDEFVRALNSLNGAMRAASPAVRRGHRKKTRRARLSFAYALLRKGRKASAISCVMAAFLAWPRYESARDVLSIIKGFPRN
jgi:glycosyltransferase involved in cell wall biosynthesis